MMMMMSFETSRHQGTEESGSWLVAGEWWRVAGGLAGGNRAMHHMLGNLVTHSMVPSTFRHGSCFSAPDPFSARIVPLTSSAITHSVAVANLNSSTSSLKA